MTVLIPPNRANTFPTCHDRLQERHLRTIGVDTVAGRCIRRLELDKGEQRQPAFLALNPSLVIAVLRDSDGPGSSRPLGRAGKALSSGSHKL